MLRFRSRDKLGDLSSTQRHFPFRRFLGGLFLALALPLAAAELPSASRQVICRQILESKYNWRSWTQILITNDSVRAEYTLKEPEYIPYTNAKGPHGEDLTILHRIGAHCVHASRPAGAKGVYKGGHVVQINHQGMGGSWGGFDIEFKQDTALGNGETVGLPMAQLRSASFDVNDPEFPALNEQLTRQYGWLNAIISPSAHPSAWEGAVKYSRTSLPLRLRFHQGGTVFLELKGTKLRVRAGGSEMWTIVQREKNWELATGPAPAGSLVDDVVFLIQASMDEDPVAVFSSIAERADVSEYSSQRPPGAPEPGEFSARTFSGFRILPLDQNRIIAEAIGMPETVFTRVQ